MPGKMEECKMENYPESTAAKRSSYQTSKKYWYSKPAHILRVLGVVFAVLLILLFLILGIVMGMTGTTVQDSTWGYPSSYTDPSFNWAMFLTFTLVGIVVGLLELLSFVVISEFLENSARQTELLRLSVEDKVDMQL